MGGPQIRNVATIGGNICNGAVSGDSASTLFALDALLKLESAEGERIIPIHEFLTPARARCNLRPGEILTTILIPRSSYQGTGGHYIKFAMRRAMDIATLGVAAVCRVRDGRFTDLRVGLGVAAPVPIRCQEAEDYARGRVADEEAFREIGKLAVKPSQGPHLLARLQGLPGAPHRSTDRTGRARGRPSALEASMSSNTAGIANLKTLTLTVNGKPVRLQVDIRETLLDVLRNHLQLTGTKQGCSGGRVRRLHRAGGRHPHQFLHLPGLLGRGHVGGDGRGAGAGRRAVSGPAVRSWTRAPSSAASAPPGLVMSTTAPAGQRQGLHRGGTAPGAVRAPVPVHRLPEDFRRGRKGVDQISQSRRFPRRRCWYCHFR